VGRAAAERRKEKLEEAEEKQPMLKAKQRRVSIMA
jgi:hypothetical protein